MEGNYADLIVILEGAPLGKKIIQVLQLSASGLNYGTLVLTFSNEIHADLK